MNWTVAICLTIAALCIPAFLLIVREMAREIRRPRKGCECLKAEAEPTSALPEIDDHTATVMFRQSFVATMMERFQDMGSPGDVLDFINRQLEARNANWRVRETPEGHGEFYEIEKDRAGLALLRRRSAA